MNSGGQGGPRFHLRYLEQDQLKENQTAGSKLREHTIGEVSPLYGMMHWIKKVRNWLKWWDIFDAELASWMGLTMLQSAWIHMAAMPIYSARLLGPDVSTRARVVGGVGSVFHDPRSTIHDPSTRALEATRELSAPLPGYSVRQQHAAFRSCRCSVHSLGKTQTDAAPHVRASSRPTVSSRLMPTPPRKRSTYGAR